MHSRIFNIIKEKDYKKDYKKFCIKEDDVLKKAEYLGVDYVHLEKKSTEIKYSFDFLIKNKCFSTNAKEMSFTIDKEKTKEFFVKNFNDLKSLVAEQEENMKKGEIPLIDYLERYVIRKTTEDQLGLLFIYNNSLYNKTRLLSEFYDSDETFIVIETFDYHY